MDNNKPRGHIPPHPLPVPRPMTAPSDIDMMFEQAALMIEQSSEHYENRLREFFAVHQLNTFTIEDVLSILGLDKDRDAALYAIPAICRLLEKLGCKTEKLIIFIPPSHPANTDSGR